MTTGQRMQQARKALGLSQKEFGRTLGVSGAMIGQYENDLRNPKRETLQRIANALGVDVDWLSTGNESRQQRFEGATAAPIYTDNGIYHLLSFLDVPQDEVRKLHKACTVLYNHVKEMSMADESGIDAERLSLTAQAYLEYVETIKKDYPEGIYDLKRKYEEWKPNIKKIESLLSQYNKLSPKSPKKAREYIDLLALSEQQDCPPQRAESNRE